MSDQIGWSVPLMSRRNRRVWLAKRRKVLGATDAVAVLGYSKWSTPLDVWLEKTGRAAPDDLAGDYAVQRGNVLEALLTTHWLTRNPDARLLDHPPLVAHPDHPMLAASLDGAAELDDDEQVVIEAKTASWRAREDWWDETLLAPDVYVVQTLMQLAVTGLERAYLIADVAGEYRQIEVPRAREFEAWALPVLADWWDRHVVGDEPPDPDPVRDYPSLSRVWVPSPGLEIEADPLLLSDIRAYRHARAEYKQREQIVHELRGRIRVAMRDATQVLDPATGDRLVSVDKGGRLTVARAV